MREVTNRQWPTILSLVWGAVSLAPLERGERYVEVWKLPPLDDLSQHSAALPKTLLLDITSVINPTNKHTNIKLFPALPWCITYNYFICTSFPCFILSYNWTTLVSWHNVPTSTHSWIALPFLYAKFGWRRSYMAVTSSKYSICPI